MSRFIPGVNDIKTQYPSLAEEWDSDKNGTLLPSDVSAHSNKKYWWKCKDGHSWLASPNNRTWGYGCPYCSGRLPVPGYNDLATTSPELLAEWDYDKNAPETPETVSGQSNRLFWWKCKNGHEWQDQPCHRARGDGCPFCSGHRVWKGYNDLATINPELAAEWNYEKNPNLTPDQITASSNKKVWWKCKEGHEWLSRLVHRNSKGLGCPYCSGRYAVTGKTDLATVNPVLAKEWHPTKNGDLTPQTVTAYSEKVVWWLCPICNHAWTARPATRSSHGAGCPNCGKRNRTSFPEQAIFYYTKQVFPDAINSYTDPFDNGMELDIYIPSKSIGIEYDGYRHKGKKADALKYRICQDNHIYLIRVSEIDREDITLLCDQFIISNYMRSDAGGLDASLRALFSALGVDGLDINISRDRMKIYEQYLTRLKDNSLAKKSPDIAAEWHPSKNGDLIPEMFNWGSGEKVWWKCSCGNEWQATIASRTSNKSGCPVCGRLKVKKGQIDAKLQDGKNSLFAVHPEFESEWDYEKNTSLDVSRITPHCNEKAWWKCSKGHEWMAVISSRSNGTGCPFCSGSRVIPGETDLATVQPDVVELWNWEKNGNLKPEQFSPKSNIKVWWKCGKGHEWMALINSISSGKRCPYCAGKKVLKGFNDLEYLRPDLMDEWNYERNEIKPSEITEHSGKKAWWKCRNCGHEWYAVIDSRSKGHGCPACARKKQWQNCRR